MLVVLFAKMYISMTVLIIALVVFIAMYVRNSDD